MKFNMSEAWREATAMMSANREVLLVVGGLFFFLPSVVWGLVMGDMQEAAMVDPEAAANAMIEIYSGSVWLIALISIASAVGYLALLALLRDFSRPTVAGAIKIGITGILPAIGTYLVVVLGLGLAWGLVLVAGTAAGGTVGVLMGTLAAAVTIYLFVKISMAGPVIAIDKVYNPFKVLARSWRLTKGNSLRLFLFFFLLMVVYIVVAMVIAAIAGALSMIGGSSVSHTINGIVSGLISAAISVVFVAVLAACHRQLSGPSVETVSATFD